MLWWMLACAPSGPTDMERIAAWHHDDPIPAVTVTDEDGSSLRLDALRGKPTLVGFVFTRCGNERACPLTMRRLVSAQEAFGAERLGIVVFTIDPAFDTPDRLAAYADRYGADRDRWVLATGEPELLREGLPSLFNVYAVGEGPRTSHPVKLTLLDANGRIVADWDDDEPLLPALEALLSE